MLSIEKRNPIVTELFIIERNLKISVVFITQFYFAESKNRLNSTHYLIMEIQDKWELQQIAFNHSPNIDFRDFMNFYKKCTAKTYTFLVIDTTLASDNLYISEKIF